MRCLHQDSHLMRDPLLLDTHHTLSAGEPTTLCNQPVQKSQRLRKQIDAILDNLGWQTDELSPECNVVTERAKFQSQADALGGKPPDYMLYRSGSDEVIGIIEAKRPGDTLQAAIRQAIENYAKPLNVPIVFASDGSITQSLDTRSDRPRGLFFARP